jgi:hypothetical protein
LRFEDSILGHPIYRSSVLAACRAVLEAEAIKSNVEDHLETLRIAEKSPLRMVASWMDDLIIGRPEDKEVLLWGGRLFFAVGEPIKAARCFANCQFLGKGSDLLRKSQFFDQIDSEVISLVFTPNSTCDSEDFPQDLCAAKDNSNTKFDTPHLLCVLQTPL